MTIRNKTYIVDFNHEQWVIFNDELKGQFSDGHWENANLSKPSDFCGPGWMFWCDIVNSSTINKNDVNTTVYRVKAPNVANKDLFECLGNRMRFYVAFDRAVNALDLKDSIKNDDVLMSHFKRAVEFLVISFNGDEGLSIKFADLHSWEAAHEKARCEAVQHSDISFYQHRKAAYEILSGVSISNFLTRIYFELSEYTREKCLKDLKEMKENLRNTEYFYGE